MRTYTPGPWVQGAASEKADIIIVAPNCNNLEDRYHPIAKIHRNHSDKYANALLIAAAPELLEAAKNVTKHLELFADQNDIRDFPDLEKLYEIIAKAEGRDN